MFEPSDLPARIRDPWWWRTCWRPPNRPGRRVLRSDRQPHRPGAYRCAAGAGQGRRRGDETDGSHASPARRRLVAAAVAAGISSWSCWTPGPSTCAIAGPIRACGCTKSTSRGINGGSGRASRWPGSSIPPSLQLRRGRARPRPRRSRLCERGGYDFDASTLVIWLDGTLFLPERAFIETVNWLRTTP